MNFLQEQEEDPNHITRRINQLVEVHEMREKVYDQVHPF